MGKFTLFTGKDGQFYWNLKAGNGEIIGKSEGYKTKASAENGIESTRKNAPESNRYDRFEGKTGKFYWNLKASNGQVICSSQGYASKDGAEKGIESCMKNAPDAELVDETEANKARVTQTLHPSPSKGEGNGAWFVRSTNRSKVGGGQGKIQPLTPKMPHASHHNRPLQLMVTWLLIVWTITAINPYNRHDWLLENLLVFVTAATLTLTYRTFQFSNHSYLLLTLFLTLHLIGAHYTYSNVPIGFTVQEWLDLSRNHFDRVVHFSFGLLLAYPIREFLVRTTALSGFLSYYIPMDVVLAFSGLFEIIEMIAAMLVSPELGDAYLGTQGDTWDAQKDMALAFIGSIIAMAITAWCGKNNLATSH